MNQFRLDGKLALVTGGSRGIGLGAAHALAQSGASIILAGRAPDELESAASAVRAHGTPVHTSCYDLQHVQGIQTWLSDLFLGLGTPDILVNAAGISRRGPAVDLSLTDWDDVLSVNVSAVFEISRTLARSLQADSRPGRIINIASLMTAAARPGTAPYTASKGAVGQLTKVLAVEWARNGILVNAIAPGYIATDLNKELLADDNFSSWVQMRCPLGRWGTPEDIGWPVVFLASEAASFITGQTLYVDGGWLSTF